MSLIESIIIMIMLSGDYNNLLAISIKMIDLCNKICGSSDEE